MQTQVGEEITSRFKLALLNQSPANFLWNNLHSLFFHCFKNCKPKCKEHGFQRNWTLAGKWICNWLSVIQCSLFKYLLNLSFSMAKGSRGAKPVILKINFCSSSYDDSDVSFAAVLVLLFVVVLLLLCCCIAVALLLYCCCFVVLLLLCCCAVVALLLYCCSCCCCFVVVALLLLLLFCHCFVIPEFWQHLVVPLNSWWRDLHRVFRLSVIVLTELLFICRWWAKLLSLFQ